MIISIKYEANIELPLSSDTGYIDADLKDKIEEDLNEIIRLLFRPPLIRAKAYGKAKIQNIEIIARWWQSWW